MPSESDPLKELADGLLNGWSEKHGVTAKDRELVRRLLPEHLTFIPRRPKVNILGRSTSVSRSQKNQKKIRSDTPSALEKEFRENALRKLRESAKKKSKKS